MIQQAFNGMVTFMVAKFIINDLPHAVGLLSNPPQLGRLDPAICSLVLALNNAGYATGESCEGHLLITGRVSNAYIKFMPDATKTLEDKQIVRDIITSCTSKPILWLRSDEVRFHGSLRKRPTASPADAVHLLKDLERGGGGPGRSVEKILSMYDVGDLKEMAQLYDI